MHIGPYKVLRQIGRGGMGTVYEVRHPEIPRPLALKVVRSDLLDPVARQRFEREGQALASLAHPNVVSVHQLEAIGRDLVLVTELVPGTSLRDLLHQRGALPPQRAREIVTAVAKAIRALHQRGLIHRDLKPDNVLLRPDGTPVVIDFGLARHLHEGSSLTQTGEILGTPSFMAPEQARDASRADARSDVYALGALLFACLSGEPPFRGATTLDTLNRLLHEPPAWPEMVEAWPPALRSLCEAALAKDPSRRPPDVEAFLAGLSEEPAPPTQRSRLLLGATGLLLAGALAGATVWALSRSGGSAPVLSPTDAIRSGAAPLPSARAEEPELECWRAVRLVLQGEALGPELRALAGGSTPGAHALGAALAARAGDRGEVERRLRLLTPPLRPELELLPSLADARADQLAPGEARRVQALMEEGLPRDFAELRGLAALVAGPESLAASLEDSELPVWARERLLLNSLRALLPIEDLDRIGAAADWLPAATRADLTRRVGAQIQQRAPREDQEDFGAERVRYLTHAVGAYRRLAPFPTPVPAGEALIKFMLSNGVDVIQGGSSPRTAEEFDFAIALADAFPDQALVQSAAGQSVWSSELANPARWRRLLVIAQRELALLEGEESAKTLGLQREKYRAQVRSRILRLLTGLQEALPPAERDMRALSQAREASEIMRAQDPGYAEKGYPADRVYVRFLEGRLEEAELAELPPASRTIRMDLVRFTFLPRREQRARLKVLLRTLSHAKREVTPGVLVHRLTSDHLWPPAGPTSVSPPDELEKVESIAEAAARNLQLRHEALSFYWWLQATRAAFARDVPRGRSRCKTVALYARKARRGELADALEACARTPDDAELRALAEGLLGEIR